MTYIYIYIEIVSYLTSDELVEDGTYMCKNFNINVIYANAIGIIDIV